MMLQHYWSDAAEPLQVTASILWDLPNDERLWPLLEDLRTSPSADLPTYALLARHLMLFVPRATAFSPEPSWWSQEWSRYREERMAAAFARA